MKSKLISVHILNISYLADNTYTYAIPDNLVDLINVGMSVSLPFGRGNRLETAIVTAVFEDEYTENIKFIHSITNEDPILTEEQIKLCFYMKSHLLCTIGEAAKCMIPQFALSRISESYSIKDCTNATLHNDILPLYEFIKSNTNCDYSKLKKQFGEDIDNQLSYLLRKGYISKSRELIVTNKDKTIKIASLNISTDYAQSLIDSNTTLKNNIEKKIIRSLINNPTEIVSNIYSEIEGANNYYIKKLEKLGLIEVKEEVVYREYYTSNTSTSKSTDFTLSSEQKLAFSKILNSLTDNKPSVTLLNGVTGSGKTNVILSTIDANLKNNKSTIVLVPEISLTPQMVSIFTSRYGNSISIIHSNLSNGERYDSWKKIKSGETKVVLGTRSAIFAPLKNLGLIIIDEEQEHTYKSDSTPKYLAHDIAKFRCNFNNALLLLASATPSLTSYYKAKKGIYNLVELNHRYGNAKLPKVEVVDLKNELRQGNTNITSGYLKDKLNETINNDKQAIIFLNRRGYNNFVTCKSCGSVIKCPNCSVSLTYHAFGRIKKDETANYLEERIKNGSLKCHYCGYQSPVPTKCPNCNSEHFMFMGYGTQQAEEEIKQISPKISIQRMDMDTTTYKHSHDKILNSFKAQETNVLLGTQMVTKGHDFPKVSLVGVLNADSSLNVDDYRASERTFSMLTQVIGRAGRADDTGVAIVQTMNPNNEIIELASKQDYKTFYDSEIVLRKNLLFPPFCDIVEITISNQNEINLQKETVKISSKIQKLLTTTYTNVKVVMFGPFEAKIYKLNNTYKNRLVIKCKLNSETLSFLNEFYRYSLTDLKSKISIDFNPTTI